MDILSTIVSQLVGPLIGGSLVILGQALKNMGTNFRITDRNMAQDLLPQGGEDEKPVTSRTGVVERSTTPDA